jgi:O-antigen/teichoic acid export membrane protein
VSEVSEMSETGQPGKPSESTPSQRRKRRPGGIWNIIGKTAAMKITVMGLSGVLGILTSRMIIQNFGAEAYAQYGLLSTIPQLLPFADLGIAAIVINAVAGSDSVRTDEQVRRTIVTALRILLSSGAVIIGVNVTITLLGWWPAILGGGLIPEGGPLTAFLCLMIFALALPLTIGQRILVGLGKNHLQVATQSVVAPLIFVAVASAILLTLPVGPYLSVLSYLGLALVSILCLILVRRRLSPQLGRALREVFHPRRYRGVPAVGVTWPMLVQMTALPLAMQTHRLLLSHRGTNDQLAQYNLASQLFGILLQTIAAAGLALWPFYAKARSKERVESPAKPTLAFLGVGLLLGAALALLSPYLADFVSDGQIELDWWLVAGFVAFVTLQATKYPLGMYMTDGRGLRFQVLPILVLVPVNLGLSWLLIEPLGAGGPVLASVVGVLLCQVIPNLLYVHRDVGRRRAAQSDHAGGRGPSRGGEGSVPLA